MKKIKDDISIGDSIVILDRDIAISDAENKIATLRSERSKSIVRSAIVNINSDYNSDKVLGGNIGAKYTVINIENSNSRHPKGTELYYLSKNGKSSCMPYGIYGFSIKKISEYTVDLI